MITNTYLLYPANGTPVFYHSRLRLANSGTDSCYSLQLGVVAASLLQGAFDGKSSLVCHDFVSFHESCCVMFLCVSSYIIMNAIGHYHTVPEIHMNQ